MTNNFASVPNDFQLAGIEYWVTFGVHGTLNGIPQLFSGVTAVMTGNQQSLNNYHLVMFQFDTPGSSGSFDQTAAESYISKIVTDLCQLLADFLGISLATVQSTTTINRNWAWTDANGSAAEFTDQLTYPPTP